MSYQYKRDQPYISRNKDKIETLTDEYTNRGKFSYDPNADSAFQEYARQMRQDGKLAMEDTVAKASAMTGGYGNSYAATAGQQVYNNYMGQIGAAQSDFRAQALEQFNAEGADLLNRVSVLENREASDKAAWEEDYLNDVGIPMTDDQKEGLKNAYINGTALEYLEALTAQGYNTENAEALAKQWIASGDLPGQIENGEYNPDNLFGTSYTPEGGDPEKPVTYTDIKGLSDSPKVNENFHVVNSEENYDLEIAEVVSDKPLLTKRAKDNTGEIVKYDNDLYLLKAGKVYRVQAQGGIKSWFDNWGYDSDYETLMKRLG